MTFDTLMVVKAEIVSQGCVDSDVSEGHSASIVRVEDESNKHLPTRIHSDIT
jgi:hypothetical protein